MSVTTGSLVAGPLISNDFVDKLDLAGTTTKVVSAVVILVITWIIAKVVKKVFAKAVQKIPALQRTGGDGQSIGNSLGQLASLLVWMFGLMAVLQLFGLTQVLAPVQSLLNGIFGFLPKLVGAGLVFFIGLLLAKVVRQLVETALSTLPLDRWLSKAKNAQAAVHTEAGVAQSGATAPQQTQAPIGPRIAQTAGTIVFALIIIVVAIAALQILDIEAVSAPAEQMLTTIFAAIPKILAAVLILALGGFIASFAADLLGQILGGLGTDRVLRQVQVLPEGKSATPIITRVIQIAIVLFFAVAATQALGFPQITAFLSEVLSLGGRVVFGAALIGAGVFIANLLARLLGGSGATPSIVRVATIVLFVAIGLKYMGIADSIIELAFGSLVVGGAAAAALAFGLGGRDAAARQLERLQQRAGQGGSTPSS